MNVYEHGVRTEGEDPPPELRLLGTTEFPVYSAFTLSIVDQQGQSLNERAVHLLGVNGPYSSDDYYEESDVRYWVLAALYHLNRLIDLYVALTQLFEQIHPPGSAIRGNVGDPRVFYEIDAFLGATRRIYEAIRKVLWKHYGGGTGGRWRSIRNALTSTGIVPTSFAEELNQSWQSFGEKLTDYGDCVAHYDPLTDGGTTCWMEWYGNRWGMTVRLPANPAEKSRRAFDFLSGPEALTYCHSVACHLVELCESLESQDAIRKHLDSPPIEEEI
jgi:hypothetical protein